MLPRVGERGGGSGGGGGGETPCPVGGGDLPRGGVAAGAGGWGGCGGRGYPAEAVEGAAAPRGARPAAGGSDRGVRRVPEPAAAFRDMPLLRVCPGTGLMAGRASQECRRWARGWVWRTPSVSYRGPTCRSVQAAGAQSVRGQSVKGLSNTAVSVCVSARDGHLARGRSAGLGGA